VYHLRTVTQIAARAVGLLALAGGGLTAAAAAASATTTADGPFSSVPVSYACSLSGYGQGTAPLTVSASVSAQSTVTTGTALTIKVVTAATQLPSGMTSGMPAISAIEAAGTSQVTGGSVNLTGQSPHMVMAAGAMTEIPSITATGIVVPKTAGTAYAYAPKSLQLLPMNGSSRLAPMTCNAASVTSVRVTVTSAAGSTGSVGSAVAPAGAQAYRCTVTTATATTTTPGEVMMRLAHSGPNALDALDNVSLTSMNGGFGGMFQGAMTPTASSASLGLTGASNGSIPLGLKAGSMQASRVMLAGRWMPQKTGMFRLQAPHRFSMRLRTVQATTVVVVCTAVTTTTTSTVVHVMASSAAAKAAEQGFAATQGSSSASSKAPDTGTGGSLHSNSDMALAVGGSVAVVAGIGIILMALRRRRGHAAV
jgi:hypothetical protein